jgi:hypothetical protein
MKGPGLFAAAFVNWLAARTTEVRAAILLRFVWDCEVQARWSSRDMMRAKRR